MRKKIVSFLALLLAATSLYAQSIRDHQNLARYYLEKFPDEEVMLKSATQLFTFDKGKNTLGDNVVTVEENSEYEYVGLKAYATAVHAEIYNRFVELDEFKRSSFNVTRYLPMEKKGYDRSVTGDDIFFDDNRMQLFSMRFADAGVAQKVTVQKNYTDAKYLTRLFFNSPYPVKKKVIEFKVPGWLKIEVKKMNFEDARISEQISESKGYTIYTYSVEELPASKSEKYRIGRAFTDPHIILLIRSFEVSGEKIKGFDNVGDVYNWNNRLYKMAGNDIEKLKAILPRIVKDKKTDAEKISAIYYWVQDNIRYIAYEDGLSGYIPASVQEVLDKKYGDCKGMANLLTELLKLAGYDAHFAWVGTRSIPYSQSLPALCVNNHAIAVLNFEGKKYFLDGTEKYVPFGENAFRIQGKEVLVADNDKYEIVTVPESKYDENRITTRADFTMDGHQLKGKVNVTITGNQRTVFHQAYQDIPSTSQEEFLNSFLEFGNDNLVATNVKTSDLSNRSLPVQISGDIDLSNSVSPISGNDYLGIDFFPKSLEPYIPDEKRKSGMDLGEVIYFDDELVLNIPAGKKAVDIPANLSLKGEGYAFNGEYILQNNKLTLRKSLTISGSVIKQSSFADWKKFISSVREFNNYLITVTPR